MLFHVSHRNLIGLEFVVAVLYAKGSAFKRLRDRAIERDLLIDCTAGRKTRSMVVLSTGQVVLTSLNPEILQSRFNKVRSWSNRQGSLKGYKEEVPCYTEFQEE
jgi:regulator of extracellular matrix RemA (YlzA/DUF370 family)